MKVKSLFWLLVFMWFLLCWKWYLSTVVVDCPYTHISQTAAIVSSQDIEFEDEAEVAEGSEEFPETYQRFELDAVQIEELTDGIRIHYPYNATVNESNPTVDNYLKAIAARLISTGQNVVIAGYTDNVGTVENNILVSEKRAQHIEQVLRKYGVSPNQLKTKWYGERNPISNNQSEEGRYQNRRVELRFEE